MKSSRISSQSRVNEQGNVLWFILIAVVLLGLLTMVLNRSGSSVDQSGDVEQRRIKSSQIMRYAKSIEAGIERLRLNGCSENEISFENPATAAYANANSPADNSCHVFEPEGAGLTYQDVSNATMTAAGNTAFVGDFMVTGVGSDTRQELVIAVGVSDALCADINSQLGINNATAVTDIDIVEEPWTGNFAAAINWSLGTANANEAPAVEGKRTGCIGTDTAGQNIFYHVLIAR